MAVECTEKVYIESASGLRERLERIIQIIDGLEILQLSIISDSNIKQYTLDDGQTKISTEYKTADEIATAIDAYEKIKQRILNKLNGRGFVLRPWQGFR